MPAGTPSYYYSGYSPYGPMAGNSTGFENSDVTVTRMNNDAKTRQQDDSQEFAGEQSAYDRLFQQQQSDADRAFKSTQSDYDRTFQGQQAQAARDAEAAMQNSSFSFQGTQADAQRAFDASQNDANRKLQETLGLAPTQFAREKFSAISPFITNALAGLSGSGSGSGNFSTVGGPAVGMQPQVNAAPIYTQQMTDQMVNQAKANNAQSTATQNNAIATKLAGQGFGSRSPLLASLQAQNQAAQMSADAGAENNIRFGNAQANADQMFRGQQLQEQQFVNANDQDIRRRQSQLTGTASLIAALGGLI